MAAALSVDHDVVRWMQYRLDAASPDPLREMVKTFGEALMAAEAETVYEGVVWTSRPADGVQLTALLRAQRERVLALATRVVPGCGPAFVADAPTSR